MHASVAGRRLAKPCCTPSLLNAPTPMRRHKCLAGSDIPKMAVITAAQECADSPTEGVVRTTSNATCASSASSSSRASNTGSETRVPTVKLNAAIQTCSICHDVAQPRFAVRLECRHGWYCLSCMERHTDARLAAGAAVVSCPECRESVHEYILKKVISKATLARLHERSVKQAVASSSNLYTCPSPNCDFCVELEEGGDPWLRKCPKCRRSSCLHCATTPYHRDMTCAEYTAVRASKCQADEDVMLRTWMEKTGTKQCPNCKMGVSKEDLKHQSSQRLECHKMVCWQCNTWFCFKCLAVLSSDVTCGCSSDRHGFVDPVTGQRIEHFSQTPGAASAKAVEKRPSAGSGRGHAPVSLKRKRTV